MKDLRIDCRSLSEVRPPVMVFRGVSKEELFRQGGLNGGGLTTGRAILIAVLTTIFMTELPLLVLGRFLSSRQKNGRLDRVTSRVGLSHESQKRGSDSNSS